MQIPVSKLKFVVLGCLVIAASGYAVFKASSNTTLDDSTTTLREASPSADVAKAIQAGDRRFLGIPQSPTQVFTPPLDHSRRHSLVLLHGIRVIEGATTHVVSRQQANFYLDAQHYASQYNKILLKSLLLKPDAKTQKLLSEVRQEMRRLETSDPIRDSRLSAKSKAPQFLMILNGRLPGAPGDGDNGGSRQFGLYLLKTNENASTESSRTM
jgi:hypothetical protein